MTDEIYYAYLDSDVTSKEFLGKYVSATAGTVQDYKVFNLYDIQMKPNYIILDNKVDYQIYSEEYQVEYRARTAELMDDNLINVTFSLYNGTINGTLIYNESSGDSYDPDNLYNLFSGGPFNYSDYENETVTGKLHIYYSDNAQIRQIVYTVPLWVGSEKIKLPLMDYVDQSFMDWFLLILFSVIALFATMQTANMASMGIIGLAALFVIFGWFSVGIGTLALAAMISLISLLAKRSDDQ